MMRAGGTCGRVAAIALALWCVTAAAHAEKLDPSKWRVLDHEHRHVRNVTDNDIDTVWLSPGPQQPGQALLIDLGREALIHRVYLTPGTKRMRYPRSMRVFFSRTPYMAFLKPWEREAEVASRRMVEAPLAIHREADLRFDPVRARYLRIETGAGTAGVRWAVAELEVYGTCDEAAFAPRDAVVLDAGAPRPLRFAAEDLRYYVGELTGRPLPIVTPDEAAAYPGTLYRILDLKPLAETYEAMVANREAGKLPEKVHVERDGREIVFRSFPYTHVLWSVWEFLERQGVRWVYPDAHGDLVPAGKGVDLDVAPFAYAPSAERRFGTSRYANFGVDMFHKDPWPEAYRYWWRNRWNGTWGNHHRKAIGGPEVPKAEATGQRTFHRGRYPHSFNTVFADIVTKEDMDAHPEWYGMFVDERHADKVGKENLGKRMPPTEGGPSIWCMGNPDLAALIARRLIEKAGGPHPETTGVVDLMPYDYATYCECPLCQKLNGGMPREENVAWVAGQDVSAVYYTFVKRVAEPLAEALPKVQVRALAYADNHRPPTEAIDRLPPNVTVDICLYGHRNLPVEAPRNAAMKARLDGWHALCGDLGHYSYFLIHCEAREMKMPVPAVTAIASRLKYLHAIGALAGSSQASLNELPYSPWNYYAYARLMWNIEVTAETILDEFFTGYFREAKDPMLAYYRMYEKHLIENDISLQASGYDYGVKEGCLTPALADAMEKALDEADRAARSWVVKDRIARMREGLAWTRARLLLEMEAQQAE